jgi:hypothetical protein
MVVSDFMKSYKGACELSFVKWLPEGTSSTNEVKELIGINQDLGKICSSVRMLIQEHNRGIISYLQQTKC